MHHETSVIFRLLNALLERILGPVSGAPSWWTRGVDLGTFHIAGVAPLDEHTHEPIAWLPDHVAMALFVVLFCLVLFPLAARGYRRTGAPTGVQNVLEVFVDFLRGVVKENIPHGEKYLPIAGGFFFFILLCNLCGLFFFLQPPTSNLNTTFALSITCFLYFNSQGVKTHGVLGYLKHFLGPILFLAPMIFAIEMIGNLARALSLAMRLFGNIYGEHTATGKFAELIPIVVPWPMNALGIFTALLQAYVFTLLATVYIGGATAHEH